MEDDTNELIKSEWNDILEDVGGFSIQQIVDSPVSELPWIKVFSRGINCIRDRILLKNLLVFMYHGRDIDLEKRCRFLEKHSNDDGIIQEKIFILLDGIDSRKKIKILSDLFRAVIMENIDFNTYVRLSKAVKSLEIEDIEYLAGLEINQKLQGISAQNLCNNGLAYMPGLDHQYLDGRTVYSLNEYGNTLKKYIKG